MKNSFFLFITTLLIFILWSCSYPIREDNNKVSISKSESAWDSIERIVIPNELIKTFDKVKKEDKNEEKVITIDNINDIKIKEEIEEIGENVNEIKKPELIDTRVPRVITINIEDWTYDIKKITAKKWERLIIRINNLWEIHWIWIPELKLFWETEIEVDTSNTWEFQYRCLNQCWEDDWYMTWTLIIK